MSLKMDRIGARTPADIERKYGKRVSENERQVVNKMSQSDFNAFAEGVNKKLANVLAADQVAEILNDSADRVDLESEFMKIKGSGFELAGGETKVTKGFVGGWVVENDADLGMIMRSPESIHGKIQFKVDGATRSASGYVFTALTPMGIMYVVKELPDFASATVEPMAGVVGARYLYEVTSFTEL